MAHHRLSKSKTLTAQELSGFCGQMAMILRAGIPASEGIRILSEDAVSPEWKETLDAALVLLDQGERLCPALRACGRFPDYLLEMVDIGEMSGRLDDVMDSLSSYYEREASIAQAIRSAVTYPCLMIAMMAVIVLVLITKVMPIFSDVYRQLGSELTGAPAALLSFGETLGQYAAVVICVIAVVVIACFVLWRMGKLHLPLPRRLQETISLARFSGGMALTLSSGLDPDESLGMVKALTTDEALAAKVDRCRESMAQGIPFGDALSQSGIFSGLYGHMVSIGCRTGSVDEVMSRAAQNYEEETTEALSRMISLLEPSLVAVLSVIVGIILLSVMLPLVGIMSGIGGI